MKSSLKNMVAVLFGITLVAAAGVGMVYTITKEPIEKSKNDATVAALKNVLPEFDQTTSTELTVDEMPIVVHTATASGQTVGYAVETMTKQGFSGVIKMVVGFTESGEVFNVNVLEQNETPGLGTKMTEEGNPLLLSFKGKSPANINMSVKQDGGDVDALTAATISSRAYVDAMARAFNAYQQVATPGATAVQVGAHQVDNKVVAGDNGRENQKERGRENRQERGFCKANNDVDAQKGGQNE